MFNIKNSLPAEIEITSKYRYELAREYSISERQLYEWFKNENLVFKRRRLNPQEVIIVYQTFGLPKLYLKRWLPNFADYFRLLPIAEINDFLLLHHTPFNAFIVFKKQFLKLKTIRIMKKVVLALVFSAVAVMVSFASNLPLQQYIY